MSSLNPELENQQISQLLAHCEASFQARQFEEAINACREVLLISPEHPQAREMMDKAQSKLEAEMFARENLRRAGEFFRQRDFQRCLNECQKIQLLEPDNPDLITLMAKAQERMEAEPFVENFINSGRSLFSSGLYSEAISQWEKVRAIDPDYPELDTLIQSAQSAMSGGSAEQIVLSQTPADEQGWGGFGFSSDHEKINDLIARGDELYKRGQYQKAIELWSEIFMIDVNHQQALERIEEARKLAGEQRTKAKDIVKNAQIAYEQGDADRAYDLFKQVKAIDPENPEADKYLRLMEKPQEQELGLDDLIQRGKEAEQKGEYRQAAQYLSQALAIDSENAQLADRIKNLNLLAKKHEQGKAMLGNARGFVAEGKLDSARHALGKILETDPGNQEALDLLQEIKKMGPGSQARAEGAPVMMARKARAFPSTPVLVGALVVIVGAAAAWFTMFRDSASQSQNITPTRRANLQRYGSPVGQKTPAQPGANATPAIPIKVTPETIEKAAKLVQEANFYLQEKHYSEALQKAGEALLNDPSSKDAMGVKLASEKAIHEQEASEQKLLADADNYFSYAEFAGAEKKYEEYLEKHPEAKASVQPQIIKCYYNLGVIAIREWRCETAADYFRQVLFIDETDSISKQALSVARQCVQNGTGDIEVRKAVALMEMRR